MPIRKAAPKAPVEAEESTAAAPTGEDYAQTEGLWGEESPDEHAEQSSSVQAGWGALRKGVDEAKARGGGGNIFQWTGEARPVLFLSDGPVSVYDRHWVDGRADKKARKTFKCAASKAHPEIVCPLCAIGNNPSLRADFQVLDLEFLEDGTIMESPRIMSLASTSAELLMDLNADKKKGPLLGNWYAVYQTGTRPRITHHFEFIKKRDLAEDWLIPLDGAEELATEYVGKVPYKNYEPNLEELKAVADEIKKSV